MRLKAYRIVSDAVERAVSYGYNRAHKHTEAPGKDGIVDAIYNEVMNELSDIIDWDEGEELEFREEED